MRKALLVTGMFDSPSAREWIPERYPYHEIYIIDYEEYRWGDHYGFDLLIGHSLGCMPIQTDPTCPTWKIHLYGAPTYIRGKEIMDFREAH